MNAPLKILICWTLVFVGLVVIVFYRYDLIAGIKRTMAATNTPQAAVATQTTAPTASTAKTPTVETTETIATPPKAEAAPNGNALANGKKLYEEKTCILCHGANGKADTPTGQAMKSTDLTSGKFHSNKDNMEATAYILKVLNEGVPGTAMVSFKAQIPIEQDRKNLADYVHSLSTK